LCQIGLELEIANSKDIFFLETLQVRANSVDRMIAEAELQGKDTADPDFMRNLGKKINALGKPLHRRESIMTSVFVSLKLMAYYAVAVGIWGIFFKKNFVTFGLCGLIVGFVISLLSVASVVAFQRTKERIRLMVDGIGLIWGTIGIVIGVTGLVAWVIKLVFIK
jgi:hypothetical protein